MNLIQKKQSKVLKNVIFKTEKDEDVYVNIFFKGGSSLDENIYGMAHLVEHSVCLSKDLIRAFNAGVDPSFDASTLNDYWSFVFKFNFYHNATKEEKLKQFGTALEYLSHAFVNEDYYIADFENEKEVIYNEAIVMTAEHPIKDVKFCYYAKIQLANQKLKADKFFEQYGHREYLEDVTIEDVHNFKDKYFTQNNLKICVFSPFEDNEVRAVFEKNFISKFKQSEETEFFYKKSQKIDSNKYYISKQRSNVANIHTVMNLNLGNVSEEEACLVAEMIDFHSNLTDRYSFLENDESFLRKAGVAYYLDFANKMVLGENIAYEFSFPTRKDLIRKSLFASARYICSVFESLSNEENVLLFLENLGEEDDDIVYEYEGVPILHKKFKSSDIENFGSDTETDFENMFYKTILSEDELESIPFSFKDFEPSEIVKIVQKVRENFVLNFIVSGDVELTDLPDIEMLRDIASGDFKDPKLYFGSMQRDLNWRNKIVPLSSLERREIETQAIICYDEKVK